MTDAVLTICLICSLVCTMTYSANKQGYAFTAIDALWLCIIGIGAFTVPYILTGFICSLI